MKYLYGLTLEQADALLAQGCAVCGTMERLVIDHCHATERVRGALCNDCNVALGLVKDDPNILRSMAAYLEAR